MVRKRSRKYDSDDNDSDSDVDFDFEEKSKATPKRYSLRERKRATLLTTDFDYYGLDEEEAGAPKKQSSDDEDFEVEADVNGARAYFEPDPDVIPENPDGLIDFEDIIRADIVVNRNKIDYDNLIQRTEIKLSQPKKRRGRPPKNRPLEEMKVEETESNDDATQPGLGVSLQETATKEKGSETKGGESEMAKVEISEPRHNGEEGLPNGETMNPAETNGNSDYAEDDKESLVIKDPNKEMVLLQPPPVQETSAQAKIEDEEDDDVIVLGELKQDVIVLDD